MGIGSETLPNYPIPCGRRRKPSSGQTEVTKNELVGLLDPIKGVGIRENGTVVSKAKHYKGVSIQIFGRVVYSIVVVDTEIPAAVRFVPEVVQQIRI